MDGQWVTFCLENLKTNLLLRRLYQVLKPKSGKQKREITSGTFDWFIEVFFEELKKEEKTVFCAKLSKEISKWNETRSFSFQRSFFRSFESSWHFRLSQFLGKKVLNDVGKRMKKTHSVSIIFHRNVLLERCTLYLTDSCSESTG